MQGTVTNTSQKRRPKTQSDQPIPKLRTRSTPTKASCMGALCLQQVSSLLQGGAGPESQRLGRGRLPRAGGTQLGLAEQNTLQGRESSTAEEQQKQRGKNAQSSTGPQCICLRGPLGKASAQTWEARLRQVHLPEGCMPGNPQPHVASEPCAPKHRDNSASQKCIMHVLQLYISKVVPVPHEKNQCMSPLVSLSPAQSPEFTVCLSRSSRRLILHPLALTHRAHPSAQSPPSCSVGSDPPVCKQLHQTPAKWKGRQPPTRLLSTWNDIPQNRHLDTHSRAQGTGQPTLQSPSLYPCPHYVLQTFHIFASLTG